ncbi:hypothetical protein FWG95_00195 [Candidatus Saccharibacteria bacterium]|nr:hypothetical protein [Candidatus Saccharibacteria bacterium]
MSDVLLLTKLVIARPDDSPVDEAFTSRVMQKVTSQNLAAKLPGKSPHRGRFGRLSFAKVLIIAILSLVLLGGGTFVAAEIISRLYPQPSVEIEKTTKSPSGRTAIFFNVNDCKIDSNQTAYYEIKRGSDLTTDDVQKILQAQCEMKAIGEAFGEGLMPLSSKLPMEQAGVYEVGETGHMMHSAATVASLNHNELTYVDEYDEQTTITLTEKTNYVVDGAAAAKSDIKAGDVITVVSNVKMKYTVTLKEGGSSAQGEAISSTPTHVVKLSLPAKYYRYDLFNQLTARDVCNANPQDICSHGASVDLYLKGTPDMALGDTVEAREISGTLISHNGASFQIKSSSGRIFTVTTPSDIITSFNRNQSAKYNNATVEIGDTIQIIYMADRNQPDDRNLNPEQLIHISLSLEMLNAKTDPIQKY